MELCRTERKGAHEAAGGAGQEAGPVWRDEPESTVGGIRSREPGGSRLARWTRFEWSTGAWVKVSQVVPVVDSNFL